MPSLVQEIPELRFTAIHEPLSFLVFSNEQKTNKQTKTTKNKQTE